MGTPVVVAINFVVDCGVVGFGLVTENELL
jgi:hypothetical protein